MNLREQNATTTLRSERNEIDIRDLWQADHKTNKRIDDMKNWVIAGMGSIILQAGIIILGIILAWSKLKGLG